METVNIVVPCRVVWSLQEWIRRDDILIERKVPRKPPSIAIAERELLSQVTQEVRHCSWAWRNPA